MNTAKEIIKQFKTNQNVVISISSKNYTQLITNLNKDLSTKYHKILMISLNRSADALIKDFKSHGISTLKYSFIEVFPARSKIVKTSSRHIHIASPQSLTELAVTIRNRVDTEKPDLVLFDSISTLLIYNDQMSTLRFLHTIMTMMRLKDPKVLYFAVDGDVQRIIKTIVLFADAVIEV